jgi:hypothetical protein
MPCRSLGKYALFGIAFAGYSNTPADKRQNRSVWGDRFDSPATHRCNKGNELFLPLEWLFFGAGKKILPY